MKDTFWLESVTKVKVELDYEELEDLFCSKVESPVKKQERSKDEELTPRKPKEVLLDMKKLQDTSIQLKTFKYTLEETKKMFD